MYCVHVFKLKDVEYDQLQRKLQQCIDVIDTIPRRDLWYIWNFTNVTHIKGVSVLVEYIIEFNRFDELFCQEFLEFPIHQMFMTYSKSLGEQPFLIFTETHSADHSEEYRRLSDIDVLLAINQEAVTYWNSSDDFSIKKRINFSEMFESCVQHLQDCRCVYRSELLYSQKQRDIDEYRHDLNAMRLTYLQKKRQFRKLKSGMNFRAECDYQYTAKQSNKFLRAKRRQITRWCNDREHRLWERWNIDMWNKRHATYPAKKQFKHINWKKRQKQRKQYLIEKE